MMQLSPLNVCFILTALAACNGKSQEDAAETTDEVPSDDEDETSTEIAGFSYEGSFDGPQTNQYNWVEMSLGIDEDGDGLAELVIGRPLDRPDEAELTGAQGMVYILKGGSLALHDTLPSIEPHTFGYGVASMGDIDGDGAMDIAVGIPVHADDDAREGFGATEGYLTTLDEPWVVDGNDKIDDFGYSMKYLGGPEHILVSSAARFLGGYVMGINSLTGEVVYTTESHKLDNDTISERRGYHVVRLGDLDGDGVPDFLMTASGQDRENAFFDYEGRVYIHSGSDGSLISIVEGAVSGDQLGTYATTIEDVDGDGYDELLIGSGYESRVEHVSGVAYVLKMGPILEAGEPRVWKVNDAEVLLREHIGSTYVELMGFSVSQVSDIDSDGVRDYAVGAPGCSTEAIEYAGCVHIFSGASGETLQVLRGDEDGYWFGEFLVSDLDSGWLYVGTKDYRNGFGRIDSFGLTVP